MRHILAPTQAKLLEGFALGATLIAFDYDGTLAPIVGDPRRARVRPTTRRLLAKLTRLYPCAVIAGRTLDELAPFVMGLGFQVLVGNYGARAGEFGRGSRTRGRVPGWRALLTQRVASFDGVVVEDKKFTLSIHYRKARSRATTRRLVLAAATSLPGVRVVDGKCVVEVLPAFGPDKGTVLLGTREALACDDTIYVGDDTADEDVFSLQDPGVLGVRVGRNPSSRAAYFLDDQRQLDALLGALVGFRSDA